MTKRAILYGRVSSDDRAKTGGANLQAQLDLCREYATKQGYSIIVELAEDDRGASGASFDLPQLSKALDMARSGEYDVLIARELDRLSRDLAKQLLVEQELKRSGVTIEYALYDFPDTPEGRLNKNLRAMLAEYEREKISQRMTRGRRRKVHNGEVMTHGRPPYGYRLCVADGKQALEVYEPEARIIRMIYTWYLVGDSESGPMATRAIAERLTQLGVSTWSDVHNPKARSAGKRGQWYAHGISKILRCRTYKGEFVYGARNSYTGKQNPEENLIIVEVPALVDLAMWEAAQEKSAQGRFKSRRNTKKEYLLQKRVRCGKCGSAMHGKSTAVYQYYVCWANDAHTMAVNCDAPYFRVDHTDAVVWNWLCGRFEDEEALLATIDEEQAEREAQLLPRRQELESVNILIADNEQERERVKRLFYKGYIKEDEYERDVQPYEKALAGLQREKAILEDLITKTEFSDADKRSILDLREEVLDGLLDAADSFEERHRMIERLNLTAELSVVDGVKIADVVCMAGKTRVIVNPSSSS